MSDQENTLNLGDDEVDESDVFYPSESDNFPKGPYESFAAFSADFDKWRAETFQTFVKARFLDPENEYRFPPFFHKLAVTAWLTQRPWPLILRSRRKNPRMRNGWTETSSGSGLNSSCSTKTFWPQQHENVAPGVAILKRLFHPIPFWLHSCGATISKTSKNFCENIPLNELNGAAIAFWCVVNWCGYSLLVRQWCGYSLLVRDGAAIASPFF